MASHTWSLICCLILSIVLVSQAHRFKLTVFRNIGSSPCAIVRCTFDNIDETSDAFNIKRISILDVTQRNVRGNVATLSQNENLYIDPARATEINGSGTISQYKAEISISINDEDDCRGELFECEVQKINADGKTEVIQKSITSASTNSSDADTDEEQESECRCSLIKYRFQRQTEEGNDAKRSLSIAVEKDKEIAEDIAGLRKDSKTLADEITRVQVAAQANIDQINGLAKSDSNLQQQIDERRRNDASVNNQIDKMKRVAQSTKEDVNSLKTKNTELDKQLGDLKRKDKLQGEALNNISHSQSITSEDISQLKNQDNAIDNEIQGLKTTNKEFKDNVAKLADKNREMEKDINELRKYDKSINQGINGLRKNDTVTSKSLADRTKQDKRISEDLAKLTYFNDIVEDDLTKLGQIDTVVKQENSRLTHRDSVVTEEVSALKSRDADIKADIQKLLDTDKSQQNQIDQLKDKVTSRDTELASLRSTRNAQYEALTKFKVGDRLVDEWISRHGMDISALRDQINGVWGQYKNIDEMLVALSARVVSLEGMISTSSKVTTVTRTTTNLVQNSCTRDMPHDSPRVQFLLNGAPATCDTKTDGGGWVLVQRRTKGNEVFNRNWNDYKIGFGSPGSPSSDFYIGNDVISNLTAHGYTNMRVDIIYKGQSYYANYSSFQVGPESTNYRMSVSGYKGSAGDSMTYHNGMQFTTFDRDNDKSDSNCAEKNRGGWWYGSCLSSNLNGPWGEGVIWKELSEKESLSSTEIKLRLA